MKYSNLYVCDGYYNTLLALLDANKNYNYENIIIFRGRFYKNENLRNLETLPFIKYIYFIDDKKYDNFFYANHRNFFYRIKNRLLMKKRILKIFDKDEIISNILKNINMNNAKCNLFFTVNPLERYLFFKFRAIDLFEEGEGTYLQPKYLALKNILAIITGQIKTPNLEKKIKNIYVNLPERLPKYLKRKSQKIDIFNSLNSLDEKNKRLILSTFLKNEKVIETINENNNLILFTQPFSEDNMLDEKEKIELYRKILKKYKNKYNIYIKPHPREMTEYNKYFIEKNIVILHKDFPAEILNLYKNLKFSIGITINSTAINNIKNIEEKIVLGIEYSPEIRKELNKRFNV